MSANDILYAPINNDPTPSIIDHNVIAQIALCLGDPNLSMTFAIDKQVSLATYLRICEIIEADRIIFKTARTFCASDPYGNFRPPAALTIKTLFETLYADPAQSKFHWTAKSSIHGVITIQFANVFSIVSGLPMVRMHDGADYEWWTIGLMSQFAGYYGYYCFPSETDARNFWKTP